MTKNNLKEIRTKIGLTQEQLADMIGTSGAYISQLETGSRNIHTIRQSTINRLCEALGCKEEDLPLHANHVCCAAVWCARRRFFLFCTEHSAKLPLARRAVARQ